MTFLRLFFSRDASQDEDVPLRRRLRLHRIRSRPHPMQVSIDAREGPGEGWGHEHPPPLHPWKANLDEKHWSSVDLSARFDLDLDLAGAGFPA